MVKKLRIIFIGPVGSGKSTNIRFLSIWLKQKGLKIRETSLKVYFPITKIFNIVIKKFIDRYDKTFVIKLYKSIVCLDLIINSFIIIPLLVLFKIKLWEKLGYIILLEEYLPGILVDYFHLTRLYKMNTNTIKILVKNLCRYLTINHAIIIYLVIRDHSILPLRWEKRGSSKEFDIYLNSQRIVFSIIYKYLDNVFPIFADKNIKEVFRDIVSIADRMLGLS